MKKRVYLLIIFVIFSISVSFKPPPSKLIQKTWIIENFEIENYDELIKFQYESIISFSELQIKMIDKQIIAAIEEGNEEITALKELKAKLIEKLDFDKFKENSESDIEAAMKDVKFKFKEGKITIYTNWEQGTIEEEDYTLSEDGKTLTINKQTIEVIKLTKKKLILKQESKTVDTQANKALTFMTLTFKALID